MKVKYVLPLAIFVFLAGLTTFFVSAANRHGHEIESFVLIHERYWRSAPKKKTTIVRIVNDEGRSLEKMLDSDGNDLKHAVIKRDPVHFSSEHSYTTSQYFDRTESIFGLTAYVFRQPLEDGEVIETWLSPKTGTVPLRQIIEKPNGDAHITDTTSIEFRKVADSEIEADPQKLIALPVGYS